MAAPIIEESALMHARYRVLRKLGAGGQAVTWLAEDINTKRQVVVKELSLRRIESISAIALFEREAKVLESLKHDAIPSYLDYFETHDDQQRFYLVQEYVEGLNFQQHIEQGTRWTESQVLDFTRQILTILVYLQEYFPPVIHRDIKPANLILRPDGRVILVDFGAVHRLECEFGGVGSMIGTTGYMPPEQFTGRTLLSSDLYSVGATLVHLLSHRHPGDMPTESMKLRFAHLVNVSSEFEKFLEILVEPVAEDRFADAKEALQWFENLQAIARFEASSTDHQVMALAGPPGTEISIRRTEKSLEIDVPANSRWKSLRRPPGGWKLWVVLSLVVTAGYALLSLSPPVEPAIWSGEAMDELSGELANALRYYAYQYGAGFFVIFFVVSWLIGLLREAKASQRVRVVLEPVSTTIKKRTILGGWRESDMSTSTVWLTPQPGSVELAGLPLMRATSLYSERVNLGAELSYPERVWITREVEAFVSEAK